MTSCAPVITSSDRQTAVTKKSYLPPITSNRVLYNYALEDNMQRSALILPRFTLLTLAGVSHAL